ncbi:ABC transporter substrate-binding protein [Bacillus solitudinis]|uniref:ABC transporter substrate-binding protein n=1 Tax=Bacillus solitudinis TaxID=2014074 RepID=UPI000C23239D|nr:extracellular solute-binding protein [Bacillus solitudinis]
MKMKVLTIAMVSVILLLLVACNGENTKESSTSNEGKEENVTITMTLSGNKATEGEDFELDVLPRMVNEKFPNITLEVQKLPDTQFETSVKTKLSAGQGPDIFTIWPLIGPMGARSIGEAGYLADLSDLPFLENINPGAIDDMSLDGKAYAIPRGIDMLGTYYNESLFEEAGIEEIPQDWNSFLEACKKLKDAGITPIVMGDKDSWWIQFGIYQLVANTVYSDDPEFDLKLRSGEEKFTNPNWVEAISKYKELYDKGYIVENSLGLGGPQAIQMFVDGKAAMVFDGTWEYAPIKAQGAVDFERGFFPLPGNDEGEPVWQAVATAAGWGVNANSKHQEEIKQILNYWFDQDSDLFKKWIEMESSISAFNGVELENEIFKYSYDLYQSNGNSTYFANQMWPGGVADTLQSTFAEIIAGRNKTPEDVAEAMQNKFDELWKQ